MTSDHTTELGKSPRRSRSGLTRYHSRSLGILACIAWLSLLTLAACGRKDQTAATSPNGSAVEWPGLVNEWIESDLKANPAFAVIQGRHEYDGLLADWSDAGLAAEIARLKSWQSKVAAIDAAALSDRQKFERDYMLAVLDGNLFWLETADWPHKNPSWYSTWIDPSVYLDRPYADLATRMKAYTKWASNVPTATAAIKANLRGSLPRAFIDIGTNTFGPLADFLRKDVVTVFRDAGDEAARAEFTRANEAAATAFADLDRHLETLRPSQTENVAMGPDLFARMLYATERVNTPIDKLEAIGRADLERNKQALADACRKFAPGKTITECVAKEEASKPEGGDFVADARQQLVDLKRFIVDHRVVTIPGEEEARVKEAPAYRAQNSAYIDNAGPFEKNMPSFFNIAAPDPKWPKAKQLAYINGKANLLFGSVHEVWPGHFLQFLHSNRSPSMFGKLYVGYAFAEGWAHYAEEMMWDEGLGAGDPEIHVGQLTNATLRNVRLLSAIGLHTKGMTLEQAKTMFLEDGNQDEGNAEQQAARGAYDPAYLNYTMGKLMILRLRDDWCKARGTPGDKACWHDFHDSFLSYGGPPIPLVRGAMMGSSPQSVF